MLGREQAAIGSVRRLRQRVGHETKAVQAFGCRPGAPFPARGRQALANVGAQPTTVSVSHEVSGGAARGKLPAGKLSMHTMCPRPQTGQSRSEMPVSCS